MSRNAWAPCKVCGVRYRTRPELAHEEACPTCQAEVSAAILQLKQQPARLRSERKGSKGRGVHGKSTYRPFVHAVSGVALRRRIG